MGNKNADMELAELADILPAENHSSNAPGLGLEAAAASAAVPELSEGSSPVQEVPPGRSAQRDRADSPGLSRLVSHLYSSWAWLKFRAVIYTTPLFKMTMKCDLATAKSSGPLIWLAERLDKPNLAQQGAAVGPTKFSKRQFVRFPPTRREVDGMKGDDEDFMCREA